MHDDEFDEFSFLSAQAADLGVDAPPPVRRRTHVLPDGRLVSALQYGTPGSDDFPDPEVTFLHGAGLNAHTWAPTILSLRLPALAVDLPGHGDSSWRDDAAYVGTVLAADVVPVLDAFTTAPQVLVGHSLGGLTAAAVAAARPDLIRELVLIDITPGVTVDGGASVLRDFYAGPADWATREEVLERALAFGFGGSRESAARGVWLNTRVREDGRVEWKHHFAHLMHALAEDPEAAASTVRPRADAAAGLTQTGWDALAAVRAPITMIRGARGFLSDADADEFRRRVPAAAVVEVPAGHNVHEELPGPLGTVIADITEGSRSPR